MPQLKEITIRKTQADDCLTYFEWVNDPIVRAMSFNKEHIPFENHCKWFSNKIVSEVSTMYVCHIDQEPIGQVRFDLNDNNEAVISLSIDSKYRGMGLGKRVITQCCERYVQETQKIDIIAFVESFNIASRKMFLSSNFIELHSNNDVYCYKYNSLNRHTDHK